MNEEHKTLYVSDLDGTLLLSTERISGYSCRVINDLTSRGMIFSYATARSLVTARKVTEGLDAKIPIIAYNGGFIFDNATGEILDSIYFGEDVLILLDDLFSMGICPIVYAFIDGIEKFSYAPDLINHQTRKFTDLRQGDIRTNLVRSTEDLKKGDIFYVMCSDEDTKLAPIYEKYKDTYHCVYQVDMYTKEWWLEIMPKDTSKANAIKRLKSMLGCDKVIAFGDGRNDIDLFEVADEGYAVANADPDLKKCAAGVILSNDEDGVAKWLEENAEV